MKKKMYDKNKKEWQLLSDEKQLDSKNFDEEFAADFIPFYTDPITGNQIFLGKNIKDDDFEF